MPTRSRMVLLYSARLSRRMVTRPGSRDGPCTRTGTPSCASSSASSAVRLGSLRAPLYDGSTTIGCAGRSGTQRSCAASRKPASSSVLSPLMRIAIAKAPISRSVTRPSSTWLIRSYAWVCVKDRAPSLPRPISLMYGAMLIECLLRLMPGR